MKDIKSAEDLAINGAPPAFNEPLHVGRPNIGSRESFLNYVNGIFDRSWLSNNGPLVQEFESKIADHHKVKHCIAMCNGTVALEIAIRALGMDGEVIVPSYTFIATAHALSRQGITPVFADINPETHNLDPQSILQMITPRTTGIIGVHLWGRPAPVEELQQISNQYGLQLMYDAAHAFGCSHKGTMVGNFGRCEVLSFHATKFFNTFEGGAILTNDDELADKIQLMRNFGFSGMDNVIHMGTNGKMIEVAAAMGLVNFESVAQVIEANKRNHEAYRSELGDLPGITLLDFDEKESNNYQYVVIKLGPDCPVSRDCIVEALHAENILARKYFWPGCHNMKPYRELYPLADLVLSNTNRVAESVIVLPTGTIMNLDMIRMVSDVIRAVVNQ